jgi:hypothetical protein
VEFAVRKDQYTDEFLAFVVENKASYDAMCRDLAKRVLKLRSQLKASEERVEKLDVDLRAAKAREYSFQSAEEYDSKRKHPAGDEAKSVWAKILDKPHWGLPAIQEAINAARGKAIDEIDELFDYPDIRRSAAFGPAAVMVKMRTAIEALRQGVR